MSDRTWKKLVQFDNRQALRELLALPERLVKLAAKLPVGLSSAKAVRLALFLSLLRDTALRSGNVVALDLTRHFPSGSVVNDGTIHLVVQAEEVNLRLVSLRVWIKRETCLSLTCSGSQPCSDATWKKRDNLRCGVCGGAYTKINATLFGCAAARNKGTCNNRINIRREAIEGLVLDGLKHRLMDPALFKVFVEELTRELKRQRAAENSELENVKAD